MPSIPLGISHEFATLSFMLHEEHLVYLATLKTVTFLVRTQISFAIYRAPNDVRNTCDTVSLSG
jgi:hypothetical protein